MGRTCTVCTHPDRDEVEHALMVGRPLRDIAGQHQGLSKTALARHRAEHLPTTLLFAHERSEALRAGGLVRQAEALLTKAASLLSAAESAGDRRTALAGVREARECLGLLARLQMQEQLRPPGRTGTGIRYTSHDMGDYAPNDEDWQLVCEVLADELSHWPTLALRIAQRLDGIEVAPFREVILDGVPETMKGETHALPSPSTTDIRFEEENQSNDADGS